MIYIYNYIYIHIIHIHLTRAGSPVDGRYFFGVWTHPSIYLQSVPVWFVWNYPKKPSKSMVYHMGLVTFGFLFFWFWRAYVFFRGRFWIFLGFPGSMLSCFSDFLLFCFHCFSAFPCFSASAFCFPCFSVFFPCFFAFLLFAFPASLLFCFSVFPASLLLYFCAFLLLLFYFFFSSVMCFCCSTSCSFASLLPVFTVSLFFIFFCFILFCLYPKWNPKETLGETQRNPKKSW